MKIILFILLLAVLAWTQATFYVSPTGNDANPGTEILPWKTIQKSMNSATAGSTVNIRAGTYKERLVMNVSGSSGNPITFQPYGFQGSPAVGGFTGKPWPGEEVILDYTYLGVPTTATPILLIFNKQYINIRGFVFQNYSVDGAMHVAIQINGYSQHIDFGWVRFENFRNVHPEGMDGTTMLAAVRAGWGATGANYVNFHDCQFYNMKTNMAEVLSYDLSSAYGVIERCHVRECDGIAIHAYRASNNYVFRNNLVEWAGVKRDGTLFYPNRGETGIGLYNDGGHDAIIEGNIVKNSGYAIESLAEGSGSGGGAQPPVYNITIRNNIFINNHYGMTIGTWYSSTDGSTVHHHDIYNNTFYGGNVGFYVRPFDAATVKIRNNILSQCKAAYSNALRWNVGTAFDYNLYFGGGTGPDANKLTIDPQFTNTTADNLTLKSTSPAINAGDPATTTAIAGTLDFYGNPRITNNRIDIGANEYTTNPGLRPAQNIQCPENIRIVRTLKGIQSKFSIPGEKTIRIVDVLGRELVLETVQANGWFKTPASALTHGLNIVRVSGNGFASCRKILYVP